MRIGLKIVIEARVMPGSEGGIQQFLIGLISGLGRLGDSCEEYLIVGARQNSDWLRPYLGSNQRVVPGPSGDRGLGDQLRRAMGPLRQPVGHLWRRGKALLGAAPQSTVPSVAVSDGFYEQLGADVLHITYPLHYVLAQLPTVFTIYDLQHRHYPQFFNEGHLAWSETVYPVAFRQSQAIATISEWVSDDVQLQYGVSAEKMQVIHLASPTEAYEPVSDDDLSQVKKRFRLSDHFVLFPALTYQHKNHVQLLTAIDLLRRRDGMRVQVVCTGQLKLYWPTINQRLRELRLQNQVRFLGFVQPRELRALYRLCDFVIFPSLFEGAGLPVLEGLREGVPVVCSGIAAHREYAGAAALYFDPNSAEEIAAAISRMYGDAELREALRRLGAERVRQFTWDGAARKYRALYRKVGGVPLSDEDEHLLNTRTSPPPQGVLRCSER